MKTPNMTGNIALFIVIVFVVLIVLAYKLPNYQGIK